MTQLQKEWFAAGKPEKPNKWARERKGKKAKKTKDSPKERVLMSEKSKKELEQAEKQMEHGKKVNIKKINTADHLPWKFIVSQGPKAGIDLDKYQATGVESLRLYEFVEPDNNVDLAKMLKELKEDKKKAAEESAKAKK